MVEINSSASADWAPDGSAFYIAEVAGSDRAYVYIYDPPGRNRLDVFEILRARDPALERFLNGHI